MSGGWFKKPKSLTSVRVMSSATWLPRLERRQVMVDAESGVRVGVALALETVSIGAETLPEVDMGGEIEHAAVFHVVGDIDGPYGVERHGVAWRTAGEASLR